MLDPIIRWIKISIVIYLFGSTLQTVRADTASETYPSRPIKILLGYPPGGGADAVLRRLVQKLALQLGTPVVIEYKPGANGSLAAAATQQAASDGYTLFLTDSSFISIHHYYDQANYDLRTFAPVSTVAFFRFAIVVNNDFPANTLPEFLSLLQANPNRYNYGSPGIGSTGHKIGEMLQKATKVQLNHIPYKGGSQMITNLIGGEIPIGILSLPAALNYANAKQLKILAVTSRDRSHLFPQVPALSEKSPHFHAGSDVFLLAPPTTPKAIVDKLNKAIRDAMNTPDIRAEFANKGIELKLSSSRELAKLINEEATAWKEDERSEKSQSSSIN